MPIEKPRPRGLAAALAPLAALVPLALVACTDAAPPAPTTVALGIAGTPDMNGGAPARVKVYYLTSDANFVAADFFQLWDDAGSTLGSDLVTVDEFLLSPGDTAEDAKSFDLAVTHIGAVAGLSDIDQPGWRAVSALAPRAPNAIALTLDGNGASFSPAAP